MNSETHRSEEPRPTYLCVLYILALATLIVFILMAGSRLLIPVTMGAFFAMLLTPVAGWLERLRLGRFAGAFVPVLGLFLVFGLSAGLAVRQISGIGSSLEGAADRVNDLVDRLNDFLSWHFGVDESVVGEFDSEGVVNLVKGSSGKLLSMADNVTQSFFGALVVAAFIFFILYYRSHLFEFTNRFLERTSREDVGKRIEEARLVAEKYLVGMMKVVAILAVLNSGALLLIGVEHAIFFGVFAAILNIVPFFGPLFGAILPILFVFLTRDSLYDPVIVGVVFIVIQLIEGNFLTPRIIGSNVRINPLVAFTGLLAGAMIWGVVGMIIAIPVLSIAMQLFRLDPGTEPFAYLLGNPPRKGRRGG